MKRLGVVLYNLGGPDSLDAVQPFLFNLFMDKAIIGAPLPVRWLLAKMISSRRAPIAQDIYKHLGGKSPLLELTQDQADALAKSLENRLDGVEVRCFIAMRYWHPMSDETVQHVKAFDPDHVIMLPLYPQFSTSTSASSFDDWDRAAHQAGLTAKTQRICCYPTEPGFIKAQADLLHQAMNAAQSQAPDMPVRVLFSAHGLPKKIVEGKGDPYPTHVEMGAQAIFEALKAKGVVLDDWLVSYQSRVGPLEWIGPSTDDEIERAGQDGVALVVLPIAFVSEHSETLVELDIEYKELATKNGVKAYVRVPAVATHPAFIDGLADLVKATIARRHPICSQDGTTKICPNMAKACVLARTR